MASTSLHNICVVLPTVWVMLHLIASLPQASAIGCFVCSSINGSEPDCEDTFNNTGRFYQEECFAGRKGRNGLFPGTECIKMKATRGDGTKILVRACIVDNGNVNSELEIGRIDHCGFVNTMIYNQEEMDGCVLSCDTNGCNAAASVVSQKIFTLGIPAILLLTQLMKR